MPLMKSWPQAAIALLAAGISVLWMRFDLAFLKPLPPPTFEPYFTCDYHQARALFRTHAAAAHAELHSIPYPLADMDLSIDIAVLHGSNSSMVVHISGTHGVEGFAGSAIQSAWLAAKANEETRAKRPTIVLVHGLNPYGMAELRRVNENNVDLNRNHLTPAQFQAKRAESPDLHGYASANALLNPNYALEWYHLFYPSALWHLAQHGYDQTFRAIVSGTYYYAKGIYYGGHDLQPSHRLLRSFFESRFNLSSFLHVVFVDVHTGLGARGDDMLDFAATDSISNNKAGYFQAFNWTADAFWSSYNDTVGCGVEGYLDWFPTATKGVAVTQEFGTVATLQVIAALRAENAMTHYAPSRRQHAAEALWDAFYLHDDAAWKWHVARQGVELLTHVVSTLNVIDGVV
ncbi:unnamed protein product [Aphanomyces euteiches]|uniref:DUF2817 domain-containing protein n=1 Tax=Aphanomyces euteiches TaxID=100861 RepID=A0A6G0WU02_9STRA|nr:hypothetical protein Ae201684_011549 [Aphanomyces euteiches]KAH9143887.1 hypothetical protein AeRB84_012130 [Aphanomyces euteiches]